jgi:hypothetical protein
MVQPLSACFMILFCDKMGLKFHFQKKSRTVGSGGMNDAVLGCSVWGGCGVAVQWVVIGGVGGSASDNALVGHLLCLACLGVGQLMHWLVPRARNQGR